MDSSNRYAKQIKVSYFGEEAQQKLMNSHVAIVGLGALGSVVAEQLTRSGIGTLTLIDRDFVELSNLQRQHLYNEHDVTNHLPKAIAAFQKLSAINSTISLLPFVAHLNASNIDEYLQEADIIIDATDNLKVRYLINEYAMRERKVWIHGAVASTYGRIFSIKKGITPCFQCIYPNVPELDTIDTCDTVGVLNSIVNIIGSMQATETMKWLIGNHIHLSPSMVEFDVWTQQMMKFDMSHAIQKECPVCQHEKYASTILCGRNTIQTYYPGLNTHTFEQYINYFKSKKHVTRNKYLCKFEEEDCTITFFPDGRCLVQGMDNIQEAELLISRLFDH